MDRRRQGALRRRGARPARKRDARRTAVRTTRVQAMARRVVDARRRMFTAVSFFCVRSCTRRPSESGLRAGSCIAKRGPSMSRRPPCRSAVARTSASPSPDPAASVSGPRQKRPVAASARCGGIPAPESVDREHDGGRGRLDRDANGAAGRAVAVGVVDEVSKRTLERVPVAANERGPVGVDDHGGVAHRRPARELARRRQARPARSRRPPGRGRGGRRGAGSAARRRHGRRRACRGRRRGRAGTRRSRAAR